MTCEDFVDRHFGKIILGNVLVLCLGLFLIKEYKTPMILVESDLDDLIINLDVNIDSEFGVIYPNYTVYKVKCNTLYCAKNKIDDSVYLLPECCRELKRIMNKYSTLHLDPLLSF